MTLPVQLIVDCHGCASIAKPTVTVSDCRCHQVRRHAALWEEWSSAVDRRGGSVVWDDGAGVPARVRAPASVAIGME